MSLLPEPSPVFRYHAPIRKPVYCPNANTLGFGKYAASRGDLIVYRENHADGSYTLRMARVLALATHDGCGVRYTKTGPRGGVKPAPRLLVLAANDTMTHAWERIVDPEDVTEIRAPNVENRTFAAWFVAGALPATESVLHASRYGALSAHYFTKYTDTNGDLREDWRAAEEK